MFSTILNLFLPADSYLAALILILLAAVVGALAALLWIHYRYQVGIDYQRHKERILKTNWRVRG